MIIVLIILAVLLIMPFGFAGMYLSGAWIWDLMTGPWGVAWLVLVVLIKTCQWLAARDARKVADAAEVALAPARRKAEADEREASREAEVTRKAANAHEEALRIIACEEKQLIACAAARIIARRKAKGVS